MEYSDLLNDPRWIAKREAILDRDDYMCQNCGDFDGIMQVHHLAYNMEAEPWEYTDSDLITLCEDCHTRITNRIKSVIEIVRSMSYSYDKMVAVSRILTLLKDYNPDQLDDLIESLMKKS